MRRDEFVEPMIWVFWFMVAMVALDLVAFFVKRW